MNTSDVEIDKVEDVVTSLMCLIFVVVFLRDARESKEFFRPMFLERWLMEGWKGN